MNTRLLYLLIPLLLVGEAAMACVGCRTPGESLGDPAKTIQAGIAMSWSVLFLLATVFGVLTLLGFLLVRACRLADASKSPPQP